MKRNILIGILLLLLIVNLIFFILPAKYEYKVLTMQSIENKIYENLKNEGTAEEIKGEKNKLKITNIEKARSQNSMPPVLNKLGKEGWRLTSINENQLYIFERNKRELITTKWEYKVFTLNDINKQSVAHLVKIKAAKPIEGEVNKFTVIDKEKAKSENIMPMVFNTLGESGWLLSSVNKAKVYIFSRPIKLLK